MAQFRNVLSQSEKIKLTIRSLEGVSIPLLEIRFCTTHKVVSDKIREVLKLATAGTPVKLPDPLVLQSVTRAANGEKKYVTARDMAAELLPLVRALEKSGGEKRFQNEGDNTAEHQAGHPLKNKKLAV